MRYTGEKRGKEGRVVEKESIRAKEIEEEEEIARLKKLARKTHDVKLRQRYDIIRLYLCKRTKPDIAAILDVSLTQVYLILKLYKEAGVEGLALKRPTGRQRKLTEEQETELRSIITEKLPKEVGLEPHCNWTAPLACKYVRDHYGVEFSERGMRDVFYRLNLSCTRPTYVLANANPQKQAEFVERLGDIKKSS